MRKLQQLQHSTHEIFFSRKFDSISLCLLLFAELYSRPHTMTTMMNIWNPLEERRKRKKSLSADCSSLLSWSVQSKFHLNFSLPIFSVRVECFSSLMREIKRFLVENSFINLIMSIHG